MKRIRFLSPAEIEMLDAAAYYEARVPELGTDFISTIEIAPDFTGDFSVRRPLNFVSWGSDSRFYFKDVTGWGNYRVEMGYWIKRAQGHGNNWKAPVCFRYRSFREN